MSRNPNASVRMHADCGRRHGGWCPFDREEPLMAPAPTPQTHTDLEFMCMAGEWPRWPYLPVKKDRWTTGVLVEEGSTERAMPVVFDPIEQTELARYDTLEELVADGWVVD